MIFSKIFLEFSVSHALRVRGLKHLLDCQRETLFWSHALRVRGLKQEECHRTLWIFLVARSTRAWIETVTQKGITRQTAVARSTRAWIETISEAEQRQKDDVARSTRAWIETNLERPPETGGARRTLYAWVD